MIYKITRLVFALFFKLYYKRVTIIGTQYLTNKATILAANHPNSLMDALILGVTLKQPIYSLARGDAFKNKWASRILHTYNMMPIYRQSEGKNNLQQNSTTFAECQNILSQNKTILIFAEGLCQNNWQLRPLKKGTARLAQQAWLTENTSHTQVIPVALTYQNFNGAGKSLIINFGKPIQKNDLTDQVQQPTFAGTLNQKIALQLQSLMVQTDFLPQTIEHKNFSNFWHQLERKLSGLALFNALNGFKNTKTNPSIKLHNFVISIALWPHYFACKTIAKRITNGTVFYDSVLFLMLVFAAPAYLITVWIFCLIIIPYLMQG